MPPRTRRKSRRQVWTSLGSTRNASRPLEHAHAGVEATRALLPPVPAVSGGQQVLTVVSEPAQTKADRLNIADVNRSVDAALPALQLGTGIGRLGKLDRP